MIIPGAVASGRSFYPYAIDAGVKFDADYISRTPGAASDQDVWTFSCWIKYVDPSVASHLLSVDGSGDFDFYFNTSGKLVVEDGTTTFRVSTPVFRDSAAWMHIVLAVDTTDGTANDRIKIWVNNKQITAFDTLNNPTVSSNTAVNSTSVHYIGRDRLGATSCEHYAAQINFVAGSALTPSSFGQDSLQSDVWVAKNYSGGYGTLGYSLDSDGSTAAQFVTDQSGNGNNWTASDLGDSDIILDSPQNNYALWSINGTAAQANETEYVTVNSAARNVTWGGSADSGGWMTLGLPSGSGKYSFIFNSGSIPTTDHALGILNLYASSEYVTYRADGKKDVNGTVSTYGASYGSNDDIEILFDTNAGSLHCINVGSTQPAISGLSTAGAFWSPYSVVNASIDSWNGSTGIHNHTPNDSAYSIVTHGNLPEPSIIESRTVFASAADTGTNIVSTLEADMQPTTWTNYITLYKDRDAATSWKMRFSDDSSNMLAIDSNAAKGAWSAPSGSNNWVGYGWQVGTAYGCFTDEVSHTNGADTDTAHSLGSGDFVAIGKLTNTTGDWYVTHPTLTTNYNIILNSSAAETTTQYVSVDDTNVTIKSAAPTGTYRVIVFKEIDSISRFKEFAGNNSADGPYMMTNLSPNLAFFKQRTAAAAWRIYDVSRNPFNGAMLSLNTSTAVESSENFVDIVSNGVKVRVGSGSGMNDTGHSTLVFMWATAPSKYANAR